MLFNIVLFYRINNTIQKKTTLHLAVPSNAISDIITQYKEEMLGHAPVPKGTKKKLTEVIYQKLTF